MNLLIKTTRCIQQEQAWHQDKHHMNNKQLTSKVILSHHNSLQVFVGSEISNSDILNYKSWDVTDLPPLKRISSPRFLSEETREFSLEVIFSFPGGFFFGMVGPLDFEEFNGTSPGDSVVFIQDTKWDISISEILVDIHCAVIYVLEYIGLVRDF